MVLVNFSVHAWTLIVDVQLKFELCQINETTYSSIDGKDRLVKIELIEVPGWKNRGSNFDYNRTAFLYEA